MKFIPHDYQDVTIEFMMYNPRALVILDMGLGKTVSSLTVCKRSMFPTDGSKPRFRTPLIIAPKIVSENTWAAELGKWDHLANMKYVEIDSDRTDLRLKQFDQVKPGVITIMSESKIQWLVDMLDGEMLEDSGREWPWDCVIIDEISLFKSPKSKRFQNLKKKLQNRCEYVYGLTGTPAPNDLSDLWAIMLLIDRGKRLGKSKAQFNKHYCKGVRMPINGGEQYITNYSVADEAYGQVLEDIDDICIAMKASDYLEDMPEVAIHKHYIKLPRKTVRLIDKLTVERVLQLAERDEDSQIAKLQRRIDRMRASGSLTRMKKIPALEQRLARLKRASVDSEDITLRAQHVFSLISIGRQLSGGAVYEALPEDIEGDDLKEFMKNRRVLLNNDAKLNKAVEIKANTPSPVLIFYHYQHEYDRLVKVFKGAKLLNTDNAQRIIPQWNRGEIPVLLANPASTKFGLNMQDGGYTIIWYGLDYSFEKFIQSNARLARQGQKRGTVDVHILLSERTIDLDIESSVVDKSQINDFVYDSLGAELKHAAQSRISNAVAKQTGKRVIFK